MNAGRELCDCGRAVALPEDWEDPEIGEGDRDDLCWGPGANHELEFHTPEQWAEHARIVERIRQIPPRP